MPDRTVTVTTRGDIAAAAYSSSSVALFATIAVAESALKETSYNIAVASTIATFKRANATLFVRHG